jgi:hypothetical protein
VFKLAPGVNYKTFDDYQLGAGLTALVYPVYRKDRGSVCAALSEHVMPACRAWLEGRESDPEQSSAFYAIHDRTFDELVFGTSKVDGASAGGLRFIESSQVVLSCLARRGSARRLPLRA